MPKITYDLDRVPLEVKDAALKVFIRRHTSFDPRQRTSYDEYVDLLDKAAVITYTAAERNAAIYQLFVDYARRVCHDEKTAFSGSGLNFRAMNTEEVVQLNNLLSCKTEDGA